MEEVLFVRGVTSLTVRRAGRVPADLMMRSTNRRFVETLRVDEINSGFFVVDPNGRVRSAHERPIQQLLCLSPSAQAKGDHARSKNRPLGERRPHVAGARSLRPIRRAVRAPRRVSLSTECANLAHARKPGALPLGRPSSGLAHKAGGVPNVVEFRWRQIGNYAAFVEASTDADLNRAS